MRKFPEVNQSFEDLFKMLLAPLRSKLLLTGIELKVFNQLFEPRSADAVAQAIGAQPRNTGVFLDGLTAIDLLKKKNGLYRNSPITQAFQEISSERKASSCVLLARGVGFEPTRPLPATDLAGLPPTRLGQPRNYPLAHLFMQPESSQSCG